jgi:hypothetical protein
MCHLVTRFFMPKLLRPTPDSYCRNGDIFTVGAAEVGDAPTVGVSCPSSLAAPTDATVVAAGNLSRPYSWG